MGFIEIIPSYIGWHYTSAFGGMVHVFRNILWFVLHLFSVAPLTRTLFSPWHRMTEERKDSFDIEDFLGTVVINLFSRLLGALFRMAVILVGLLVCITLATAMILLFLLWIFLPGLIVLGFFYGGTMLFV